MTLKDDILALREAGLSYGQIKEQLGCSKSTVGYHLSEKAREHSRNRNRKRRKANPLLRKVEVFQSEKEPFVPQPKKSSIAKDQRNKVTHFHKEHAGGQEPRRFTFQDVLDKFGSTPKCYLTGGSVTRISMRPTAVIFFARILSGTANLAGRNLTTSNMCGL